MFVKIKSFTYIDEYSDPKLLGTLNTPEKQTFVNTREKLEDRSIVDWQCEFWDGHFKCTVEIKLKSFNMHGSNIYVIPISHVHLDSHKRL